MIIITLLHNVTYYRFFLRRLTGKLYLFNTMNATMLETQRSSELSRIACQNRIQQTGLIYEDAAKFQIEICTSRHKSLLVHIT
jgi:hypothetical protein